MTSFVSRNPITFIYYFYTHSPKRINVTIPFIYWHIVIKVLLFTFWYTFHSIAVSIFELNGWKVCSMSRFLFRVPLIQRLQNNNNPQIFATFKCLYLHIYHMNFAIYHCMKFFKSSWGAKIRSKFSPKVHWSQVIKSKLGPFSKLTKKVLK